MSWIFLSHSRRDSRQAVVVKHWLAEQRPELANEIFVDIDPQTGLRLGAQCKGLARGGSWAEHRPESDQEAARECRRGCRYPAAASADPGSALHRLPHRRTLTLANWQSMGGMCDVLDNEIEQILPSHPQQRRTAPVSPLHSRT